jgi:hypothetical protein
VGFGVGGFVGSGVGGFAGEFVFVGATYAQVQVGLYVPSLQTCLPVEVSQPATPPCQEQQPLFANTEFEKTKLSNKRKALRRKLTKNNCLFTL